MDNKPSLIVFDMDGTLYPKIPQWPTTYREAATSLISKHRNCSPERALKMLEAARRDLAQRWGGRSSTTVVLLSYFPEIGFEELAVEVDERHEVERLLQVDQASVGALERLSDEYPILLHTLNNERTAERVLSSIAMAHLFPREHRYTLNTWNRLELPRQEKIKHLKPGLEGFRYILKESSHNAAETLMVGDSLTSDIEPAQRLGMQSYHVKEPKDLVRLAESLCS